MSSTDKERLQGLVNEYDASVKQDNIIAHFRVDVETKYIRPFSDFYEKIIRKESKSN